MDIALRERRLPIGAEVLPRGGVHFRVWAPDRRRVAVVLEGGPGYSEPRIELDAERNGYHSGTAPDAGDGTLYRFELDGGEMLYPDPASRFQPEGPHGPSQVVDPTRFRWNDEDWQGAGLRGQVIYEMHIGTFTREGTWAAAVGELPELARAGITLLEVMPVAEFSGRFGWGYDGADMFAPTRLYGGPDDFRRFVDQAHAAGIGVILDVVYNHFGPDGCHVTEFAKAYLTDRYDNEWGQAINFDGPDSGPVREFFIANAGYWIDEYHLDGLRLDATQSIHDRSPEHVIAAITRQVRNAARGRATLVVAENEPQNVILVRPPERGGYGVDALWNDDFHHSAMVALTGHHEAYYHDHLGTPQELISAAKWGYLFQGQYYSWQKQRRGTPALDLPAPTFVTFIQNHDQVANSGRGERAHQLTSPGQYRAMTALMLLMPGTPMLFQGQEFCASTPFLYFADHKPELAEMVRKGRAEFLAQFPTLASPEMQAQLADPAAPDTFERSKLDLSERESHRQAYDLHRDLLKLRREDPVLSAQRKDWMHGAVLNATAFLLRFIADDSNDRLLLVNLGCDLSFSPAPEPLLAPPQGTRWTVLWSSEDPRYGGYGIPAPQTDESWLIPGQAAIVLSPHSDPYVDAPVLIPQS